MYCVTLCPGIVYEYLWMKYVCADIWTGDGVQHQRVCSLQLMRHAELERSGIRVPAHPHTVSAVQKCFTLLLCIHWPRHASCQWVLQTDKKTNIDVGAHEGNYVGRRALHLKTKSSDKVDIKTTMTQ